MAFHATGLLPEDGTLQVVLHGVVALIVLDALGQPKISDLDSFLILYQHVSSCQVSVDVVQRPQIVHSLE